MFLKALSYFFLTLLFPIFLGTFTGMLRAIFGISFHHAFLLSCIPSLLALLGAYKLPKPKWYILAYAAVFLVFLFERNFFSLATLGNADSGLHLERLIDFATKNPDEYHGFVSYYASVEVLRRYFQVDYLWAIAYPLYVAAFVLFVLMLSEKSREESWILYLLRMSLVLSISTTIVFQFIGQGAFAHVWAMPITLVMFRLATSPSMGELARFVSLGAALVVLRYSYGLNLADHILAVAVLACFAPWPTKIRFPIASGIFAVSVLAYMNIWEVLGLGGAKTKISLGLVWLGLCISGLAALWFRTRQERSKRVWNAIMFVSLLTVCVQLLYWQTGGRLLYYGMKYPMGAILVVCAGFGSLAWQGRKSAAWISGGILIYFLLLPLRPYLGQMLVSEYRVPLLKSKVYSAIEKHLQEEGKQFGGFLTPNWPAAKFVGAAFHFRQSTPEYKKAVLKEEKNNCVFWEASPGRFLEMQRVMQITHGNADQAMSRYRRLYSTPSDDYSVGMIADGELAYLCR
jgi:hypothetical protein